MSNKVGIGNNGDMQAAQTCRLCGAAVHHVFLDLGMMPPCEGLVESGLEDTGQAHYPLRLMACGFCYLVQLVPIAFPDKPEEDAGGLCNQASPSDEARFGYESLVARLALGPKSQIIEIGGDGGELIRAFQRLSVPALAVVSDAGIWPWHTLAYQPHLATSVARELAGEGLKADLLFVHGCLEQAWNLNDFVSATVGLLKPDGMIVLRFRSLLSLISDNRYDEVRHEDVNYLSLLAIEQIAARHQLRLHDVEAMTKNSSFLRAYLVRSTSSKPQTRSLSELLERERSVGLHHPDIYQRFNIDVQKAKRALLGLLIRLKDEGHTICGYGADADSISLLNRCRIGPDLLDFTVDPDTQNYAALTSGMRVPILSWEALAIAKPAYLLILSWARTAEIVQRARVMESWGGRFIVPLPQPHVINPYSSTRETSS
jgi:hypothetical protein